MLVSLFHRFRLSSTRASFEAAGTNMHDEVITKFQEVQDISSTVGKSRLNRSDIQVYFMYIDSVVMTTHLPNTSEGLSSSRSFPPLLVSYVANPPSEFFMLRSYKKTTKRVKKPS